MSSPPRFAHAFLFLFAGCAFAADPNFSAHGLTAPVFDASGYLVRRITAASLSGPVSTPSLTEGRVDFFAPQPEEELTATLTFDHAVYDQAIETLTGEDALKLVAAARHETLSGHGYVGHLDAGHLTLQSAVIWESASARLSGDHAEVRFNPKAPKNESVIQEVEMTGHVVFERLPGATTGVERAETTLARYDAAQQKIYLKSPVALWTNGHKAINEFGSGFMEIILAERNEAADPSASTKK